MQENRVSLHKNNEKRLFFSGVAVLTVASLLVKFIGVFYKVPLNHLLGSEGMAAFNAAYSIYTWLYMVSTAGLPVAVSILISESRAKGEARKVKRIFRLSVFAFVLLGVLGLAFMLAFAKPISAYNSGGEAFYSMLAIAPALFFICISSALRGYFQGFQEMMPTAVSQVIEAVSKVFVGVVFARHALKMGYPPTTAAAFAIIGVTLGIALGMAFLIFERYRYLRADRLIICESQTPLPTERTSVILKRLLTIALPVTVSASVLSLTNVIDTVIMADRLGAIGYGQAAANSLYGDYSTGAVTLFNLPAVLIYPIAYSIVPLISSARAGGRHISRIVESAMRVAAIIGLPCSLGLSVFARPIIQLVFSDAEMAEHAGPLLSILALSVFFVCLLSVSTSALQACGHANLPIASMLLGGIVKLLSSYFLIGSPSVGISGTPIGTLLCYITAVLLNLIFLARCIGGLPSFQKVILRPLICSVFAVTAATAFYLFLSSAFPLAFKLWLLLAILIAGVLYFLTLFLFRAITKEDFDMIPHGERFLTLFVRLRLLKER